MRKSKKQQTEAKDLTRREFLKKTAECGSIAALIASGALDSMLSPLFAQVRKYLSREALEGPLPNKSLETIRNLLKGEYFAGGRFYSDLGSLPIIFGGLCDPVVGDPGSSSGCTPGYCYYQWSCSGDCCGQYGCYKQACPSGYCCSIESCVGQICGGVAGECPRWTLGGRDVDTREIKPFVLGDIQKYPDNPFIKELIEVMNLRSTASLEREIKDMIQHRQTLKMKGYIQ